MYGRAHTQKVGNTHDFEEWNTLTGQYVGLTYIAHSYCMIHSGQQAHTNRMCYLHDKNRNTVCLIELR